MRSLKRLRKLWNDVLNALEASVLAWIIRKALERHQSEPIETNYGPFPDSPSVMEPWCLACVTHWPCKRFQEVASLAEKLNLDGS
jgi:hypothetical protein